MPTVRTAPLTVTPLSPYICKISIILPVYNAEQYLPESIQSLLNQSFSDFEIVIVNDKSTDSSIDIAQKYACVDNRILIIEHIKNFGVSQARNTALSAASGEYLVFMDADDISAPERLQTQLDHMQQNDLDVCGSYMQAFGAKSRALHYPLHDIEIRRNLYFYGRTIATPSVMIKRNSFKGILFNPRYSFGEDYDLWINIALNKAARFGNIPKILVHYRKHENQASCQLKSMNHTNMIDILHRHLESADQSITKKMIELHYSLLKEKHRLSSSEIQPYKVLLNKLASFSETSKSSSEVPLTSFYYTLFNKRFNNNLNSWKLYNQLTDGREYLKSIFILLKSFYT